MIYRLVWGNPFHVYLLILFRHIHIITQAHTINRRKVLYLNQITLFMLISPQLLLMAVRKHTFLSQAALRLPGGIATPKCWRDTTGKVSFPGVVTVFESNQAIPNGPCWHCQSRRKKAPHRAAHSQPDFRSRHNAFLIRSDSSYTHFCYKSPLLASYNNSSQDI